MNRTDTLMHPVRPSLPSRLAPRRRRFRRGFTLVELIVALTAGLIVSAAAYTLANNSMKSFQDESRIASSQMAASVGFARLESDLSRAAYMSSPNSALDPMLCTGGVPAGVTLEGLRIIPGGSGLGLTNGYGATENPNLDSPDAVIVTGNMTSAEQFAYRTINGDQMYLSIDEGPMRRLMQDTGGNGTAIAAVFVGPTTPPATAPAPRLARVIDDSGKHTYIRVTNVQASGTQVTLTVEGADGNALAAGTTECAIERGGLINPVSIIRYRIGAATNPSYAEATNPLGAIEVTGEDFRTELLREEIHPDSADDPGDPGATVTVEEIVAEFGVRLDLSAYVWDGAALAFQDFDDAALGTAPAQQIRAVGLRFATRARVPDRDAPGPAGELTRFFIPSVGATTRQAYARMRTLETQIQLQNYRGLTW